MKGIIFLLTLFVFTAPVFATVTIDLTPGVEPYTVVVSFSSDEDPGKLVRAIALDIQVNEPNVWIEDVNCVSAGYYIYPGSININASGEVDDYGTCAGVIDGNHMTSEQGSAYVGAANEPAEGDLFIVTLGGCTLEDPNVVAVTVSLNALRGGIVMEDAGAATTVVLNGCTVNMGECCAGDCGPICPGDVAGSTSPEPDGIVNTADLGALLGLLGPLFGSTPPYEVCPIPVGFECMDLAGSTSPAPDGCINTADLGALLGYLGPLYGSTPPYEGPCITLP